jgi:predicted DNA-binding protein with PD1-like motif
MTATFTAIGVLKNAQVEFCDQEKHEYMEILLSPLQKSGSCLGNISRMFYIPIKRI